MFITFHSTYKTALKHLLLALLIVSLLDVFPMTVYAENSASRAGEYELKAAYLYNFFHFIQWPTSENQELIAINVIGKSPINQSLDKVREHIRKSTNKEVEIRYFDTFDQDIDLVCCKLLFISSSEKANFRAIIRSLKNAPVLTVSDEEGFLEAGGMINFISTDDNKIRWEINRVQLNNANLGISAKLQEIAVRVITSQNRREGF
ncbi:MAG: YfiR family protein [Proteobacteria bacterium]|nr:YfiR family protein [Pseudomonadota bacterium]MBU1710445.1 YfiR family protein [Pseudomonadota bacterium]